MKFPFFGKKNKDASSVNARSAKAVRQDKINSYYKKKNKKGEAAAAAEEEVKKVAEEAEVREPAKEETSRPEAEQPVSTAGSNVAPSPSTVSNKAPSAAPSKDEVQEAASAVSNKVSSADEQDDEPQVAASASAPHVEEKKSEAEPETISPPRMNESNVKDDHESTGEDDHKDVEDLGASASAGSVPASPSSNATPKKTMSESRDPPPHSTPDVSFCGCFN